MISLKTRLSLAASISIAIWMPAPAIAFTAPLPEGVEAQKVAVTGAYSKLEGTVLPELPLAMIEAGSNRCLALEKRPLVVTGPQSALSKVTTDIYFLTDRTAAYRTDYHLITKKGDPCAMSIEPRQTARITTFDGRRTERITMDLTARTGKRSTVDGRSPLLSYGPAIDQAGPIAKAPTIGKTMIAYRSCEIKVIKDKAGTTELCLLSDLTLDSSLLGIPLKVVRTSTKGNPITSTEATEFRDNVLIDLGVFDVPKDIKF